MALQMYLVLSTLAAVCFGQRPFFAGSLPHGYPTSQPTTTKPNPSGLENRFNEAGTQNSGTTERLPVEALGDKRLVDFLNSLPVDQQPFWFLNWKANEAQRQKPQTYDQRPNPYINWEESGINTDRWA